MFQFSLDNFHWHIIKFIDSFFLTVLSLLMSYMVFFVFVTMIFAVSFTIWFITSKFTEICWNYFAEVIHLILCLVHLFYWKKGKNMKVKVPCCVPLPCRLELTRLLCPMGSCCFFFFKLRLFTLYHRFQIPLVLSYAMVEASLSESFSQSLSHSVLGLIFVLAMFFATLLATFHY